MGNRSAEDEASCVSSTTGSVAGLLCGFFGTEVDVVVSLGSIFLCDAYFNYYLVLELCSGLHLCDFFFFGCAIFNSLW
jgi:hypothetical protein